MHLGPYQNAIEGELPFEVDIQNRVGDTKIAWSNLAIEDPFHPMLENVNPSNLQGFVTDGAFATAILNTIPQGDLEIPKLCGGAHWDG